MSQLPRRRPYRHALDDLVDRLLPGARVTATRRMRGGIGTLMHAVDVRVGAATLHLTLRRFNQPEWGMDAELARRESAVLTYLSTTDVPVPDPLWVDAEGAQFGVPALLLRRLPGRPDLAPDDVGAWATGLASALALIHAVDPGPLVGTLPDETREARQLRHLRDDIEEEALGSSVVDAPALVAAALELHATGTEEGSAQFTHGDFHAGNVLWHDGVVSGVVDWPAARLGDPRFDLAYLRLDTSLILGGEAADAVLAAYEKAAGARTADMAAWDLLAATTGLPEPTAWGIGWADLGREDLDDETIRRRYAAFVRDAFGRLGA